MRHLTAAISLCVGSAAMAGNGPILLANATGHHRVDLIRVFANTK